jgi:hypothetical protein
MSEIWQKAQKEDVSSMAPKDVIAGVLYKVKAARARMVETRRKGHRGKQPPARPALRGVDFRTIGTMQSGI